MTYRVRIKPISPYDCPRYVEVEADSKSEAEQKTEIDEQWEFISDIMEV